MRSCTRRSRSRTEPDLRAEPDLCAGLARCAEPGPRAGLGAVAGLAVVVAGFSAFGGAVGQEPGGDAAAVAPERSGGIEWTVVRTGASTLRGRLRGATPKQLQIETGDGTKVAVAIDDVVSLHGPTPNLAGDEAVALLLGGERVYGRVRGGDADGDTVTLVSRSLGPVIVPIDSLQTLLLSPRARRAPPGTFAVPPSDDADEALYQRAERGYDVLLGEIERFSERGVLFRTLRAEGARLFLYRKLDAISIRDGYGVEGFAPDVRVLTRAGDTLQLKFVGADMASESLRFEQADGQPRDIALAQVAACTWLRPALRYASDLDPLRLTERGSAFDDGALPLYPLRRDASVVGSILTVRGEAHAKGLGVHSSSEVVYRAPAGATRFVARVGIDDTVLATPVRGRAEVSVMVDDEVVFGPVEIASGAAARDVHVSVQAGQRLTLRVAFGPGHFFGDRVDWLGAAFVGGS